MQLSFFFFISVVTWFWRSPLQHMGINFRHCSAPAFNSLVFCSERALSFTFSVDVPCNPNRWKWLQREGMHEACGKTRNRLILKSFLLTCAWLWHMLLVGIIYGKVGPATWITFYFKPPFMGQCYFYNWLDNRIPQRNHMKYETIWKEQKILMWLDLEQFQGW